MPVTEENLRQKKTDMQRNINTGRVLVTAALILLAATGFIAHRRVPFMMDDEWYATNLVTGEPLASLSDIVESQVWHFLNWGGRCVTHGVLQLTLMSGELCADIFNLLMTFLLTFLVCAAAQKKSLSSFLLVHAAIYACNANVKMSMLWQAGAVNYIYSSVWILLFMLPYLRKLYEPDSKDMPLAAVWLLPMGLMAGWSNENMGPVCFLLAAGTVIWLKKWRKLPIKGWMVCGMASSLLGSVLVVAAPGNFVRSAIIEKQSLYERFYSMLTAGTDFLWPAVLPMTALLLIKIFVLHGKPDRVQWTLLTSAILSFGAMVLSPHYPDRATMGTMILCLTLSLTCIRDMERMNSRFARCTTALTVCFFLCAEIRLIREIFYL
ncbi:MAG: DUF6056 family protein [Candidatus Gastranaerophilales bacterium]|nr:DUF6056 family protein [Candidatus Gastranaerophilales bacterium]